MDDIVETEMLSVKQVAQMYGKAPNTIWVWTRNNKIPQPTYFLFALHQLQSNQFRNLKRWPRGFSNRICLWANYR